MIAATGWHTGPAIVVAVCLALIFVGCSLLRGGWWR